MAFQIHTCSEGEIPEETCNDYGEWRCNSKLLYPWIHQWIYADTPMASKVDRKTLSEHEETGLSPELEEGDIIRVIELMVNTQICQRMGDL